MIINTFAYIKKNIIICFNISQKTACHTNPIRLSCFASDKRYQHTPVSFHIHTEKMLSSTFLYSSLENHTLIHTYTHTSIKRPFANKSEREMRYNLLVVAKTCPESNRSVLLYPTEWIIIGRIFVVIKHTHTSPSMHTSASAAHGNMRAHTLWRESKQTQHIYEHLISFGLCFGCVWMCVSCRVRSRGSVSSFSEQNILNKCYTSSSLFVVIILAF